MSPAVSASPRKPRLRTLVLLGLAAMLAMHAWVFFTLRQEVWQGYPDFTAFYSAGKCVVSGLGPRIYDTKTQAQMQQRFASQVKIRQGPLPFTHPPFEAALFAPLALLPYRAAYWTWNGISLMALAVFLLLWRPQLSHLRTWSGALPYLASAAFFPVFVCLLQGQDSLLLLLLFGLAFAAMKGGREFVAGICCGLALFRFQLVLPVMAVVLVRRRWKMVGGFVLAAIALGGVSLGTVGWAQTLQYPRELLQISHVQGTGAMNPGAMPNLRGMIFSFLGESSFAKLLTALGSLALVALAAGKWKADRRQPDFDLGFGLAIAVAVMVSYHMMAHDLSVLLIPLLLAAEWLLAQHAAGMARQLLIAAISLLFFSPIYFLLWFRYGRFSAVFWLVALLGAGLSVAVGREKSRFFVGLASPAKRDRSHVSE